MGERAGFGNQTDPGLNPKSWTLLLCAPGKSEYALKASISSLGKRYLPCKLIRKIK